MILAAKAWRLREKARLSLASGDFEGAVELSSQAQELCRTRNGEFVGSLAVWCYGARLKLPGADGT